MSDERLAEMLIFIRKWGSGNGWTGQLGQACCYIHELLAEVERLKQGKEVASDGKVVH